MVLEPVRRPSVAVLIGLAGSVIRVPTAGTTITRGTGGTGREETIEHGTKNPAEAHAAFEQHLPHLKLRIRGKRVERRCGVESRCRVEPRRWIESRCWIELWCGPEPWDGRRSPLRLLCLDPSLCLAGRNLRGQRRGRDIGLRLPVAMRAVIENQPVRSRASSANQRGRGHYKDEEFDVRSIATTGIRQTQRCSALRAHQVFGCGNHFATVGCVAESEIDTPAGTCGHFLYLLP